MHLLHTPDAPETQITSAREYRHSVVARKKDWQHLAHAVHAEIVEAHLNGERLSPRELMARFGLGDGLSGLYTAGGAVFLRSELARCGNNFVEAAARRIIPDRDTPRPFLIKPREGLPRYVDNILWSATQMEGAVGHKNIPRLRLRIAALREERQRKFDQQNERIRLEYDALVAAGKAEPVD